MALTLNSRFREGCCHPGGRRPATGIGLARSGRHYVGNGDGKITAPTGGPLMLSLHNPIVFGRRCSPQRCWLMLFAALMLASLPMPHVVAQTWPERNLRSEERRVGKGGRA